jgi:PPK2 family polyphosphate:nucleotide phosphotransferase
MKLHKISAEAPSGLDKKDTEELTARQLERLEKLQNRLYAEGRQKLLIILQGMDASGKDSSIRHVMGAFNPMGVRITSFKKPEASEASRDFLWRCHKEVPAAGQIAVFNRSYYEDVLVVRVEKLKQEKEWKKYYQHINAFEELLKDTGTQLLKFYLHITENEQKKKLKERMDDEEKNWKFNAEDWAKRKKWDQYMEAYQDVFRLCSSKHAPWHIIPANDAWYRNHCMAKIILEKLKEMDPKFPKLKGRK